MSESPLPSPTPMFSAHNPSSGFRSAPSLKTNSRLRPCNLTPVVVTCL